MCQNIMTRDPWQPAEIILGSNAKWPILYQNDRVIRIHFLENRIREPSIDALVIRPVFRAEHRPRVCA